MKIALDRGRVLALLTDAARRGKQDVALLPAGDSQEEYQRRWINFGGIGSGQGATVSNLRVNPNSRFFGPASLACYSGYPQVKELAAQLSPGTIDGERAFSSYPTHTVAAESVAQALARANWGSDFEVAT